MSRGKQPKLSASQRNHLGELHDAGTPLPAAKAAGGVQNPRPKSTSHQLRPATPSLCGKWTGSASISMKAGVQ